MELGATLAGETPEQQSFIVPFSKAAGTIYQIRDDLVGVLAPISASGKNANDLQEGKQSVPILCAYNTATPAERLALDEARRNPGKMSAAQEIIGNLALSSCRELMNIFAAQAHDSLLTSDLESVDLDTLHGFIDYLVTSAPTIGKHERTKR